MKVKAGVFGSVAVLRLVPAKVGGWGRQVTAGVERRQANLRSITIVQVCFAVLVGGVV